jgi:acid phosphatase (class A)
VKTGRHVAVRKNADASFSRFGRLRGVNPIRMKKLHLTVVLLAASSTFVFSQKQKFKELTPAKGYYKELQIYDQKPGSPGHEADGLKFPFDAAAAEKRLALKPYYLQQTKLEDLNIPEPPANSSEQTRAELNYLLQLQEQRTKLDVESSMYMASVTYSLRTKPEDSTYTKYRNNLFHVGRSVGTWFNPQNLPITAELMAHVWQDANYFIWAAKYKYLRVRPYTLEKDIHNLEDANWASYPSGHSANSYINAYIYQELAPEFSEVFIKDAYDMAHSREILGVHYPSDSEASRLLARQLVNKLFTNEKFLSDFEMAKKEWSERAKEPFSKPQWIKTETLKAGPGCGSTTAAKTCQ